MSFNDINNKNINMNNLNMNNMNNINYMNLNNMNDISNMSYMNNVNFMNNMNIMNMMKNKDNMNNIYNMSCINNINNLYFNNKIIESFFEKNSIYFLFSYEKKMKKEKINIFDYKYEKIQIAEAEKEGKNYIVECIKIKSLFGKNNLILEVGKKSYDLFLRYEKNFLFDLIFIEQKTKKEV